MGCYRRDGFVVRETVFGSDDVAELRDAAENAVASAALLAGAGIEYLLDGNRFVDHGHVTVQFERPSRTSSPTGGETIRVIEPVHQFDSRLSALVDDSRIVEPMRDLVGCERIALWTDKLNLKRPHEGSGFRWHQDSPYWIHDSEDVDRLPNVFIALDDAAEVNGALRIVRGSHTRGCLPGTGDDTQLGGFFTSPDHFDDSRQVLMEVAAGSVVFFSPHAVHGSQPNASDQPRRALILTYQPGDLPMLKSGLTRNVNAAATCYGGPQSRHQSGFAVKKFLLSLVALLMLLIVVPPTWNALFPMVLPDLPAPGVRVSVREGAAINALDVGAGQPVVLVHGLPGSAYDWRHLTPELVKAGFRVIAYDRLGYGHSDVRPGESHTVQENAADLLALLDTMNLQNAIVVGWSYGGATVMQAATQNPSRMARMVLIGTGGPTSANAEPPQPGIAARVFYSTPMMRWRSAVPGVARNLMEVLSDTAFSGGPQPGWWLEGLQASFKRWETTSTYRAEMFAPIDPDAIAFSTLPLPTLIIHAEDDRLAPVEIARYLSTVIPEVEYVEVPAASHMLPVTHAPWLAEQINAFVLNARAVPEDTGDLQPGSATSGIITVGRCRPASAPAGIWILGSRRSPVVVQTTRSRDRFRPGPVTA